MTNGAFCHPKKSPAVRNSTERHSTEWAIDLTRVNRRHCIIGSQRQNRATGVSGEFSAQGRIGSCWLMCRYAAAFPVAVEKGRDNGRGNNLGRKVEMNRSWVIALLGIGKKSVLVLIPCSSGERAKSKIHWGFRPFTF